MDYLSKQWAELGAGDWSAIFACLIAALLCWRAFYSATDPNRKAERSFWAAATMALLFLGLNELLDLQTVLTATGRSLAREQGWYRERRTFQLWFMVIFSIAALLGAALALWKLRNALWPVRLAMIGFVAIAIYVVLRAASFHHTDQLLRGGLELVNFGSLLEMGGIAVVAISAAIYERLAEKSV